MSHKTVTQWRRCLRAVLAPWQHVSKLTHEEKCWIACDRGFNWQAGRPSKVYTHWWAYSHAPCYAARTSSRHSVGTIDGHGSSSNQDTFRSILLSILHKG
jgi:hypothetical protein